MSLEIRHYVTVAGADPFADWLVALTDRKAQARAGYAIVLLLLGGDKRKQNADIKRAKEYWRDYQQRKKAKDKRSR